jgi:hypothetical protein
MLCLLSRLDGNLKANFAQALHRRGDVTVMEPTAANRITYRESRLKHYTVSFTVKRGLRYFRNVL